MPPRVARSSVSQSFSKKPTSNRHNIKRKSRGQDAFALASASDPDHVMVRQHRLGESELDVEEPRKKRQRMLDEETDDEDDEPASNARRMQQKNANKEQRGPDGFSEENEASGSDGEGNHWRIGPGEEDGDDESVDSDEAFGDSDEEKFEGHTFRGSKSMKNRPKKRPAPESTDDEGLGGVNLNEEEPGQADGDESDDSLGSDAVDLATALDQYDEDDEDDKHEDRETEDERSVTAQRPVRKPAATDDWAGFSDSDASDTPTQQRFESEDEGEESPHTDEEVYEAKPSKSLRDIAASFASPEDQLAKGSEQGGEDNDQNNGEDPKLQALLAAVRQRFPNVKIPKLSKKDMAPAEPLSKRQQDRIDRSAAYKKAKETLDRWQDTVKQNRRAEHLHFPLVDPEEQHPQGEHKIMPATTSQPRNDLEHAIEGILQESGLANKQPKPDEDDNEEAGDELPEQKKLSKREERERLMELRKAREMIFREEQRSKRIKKIKSKAYRRIHRRERDRNDQAEQAERQMLIADGMLSEDEDEREKHDRRRAVERMGSRHKNSRWAKSLKTTGRAAWDEDAKDAVNGMNARDQEIRLRMPPSQDDSGSSVDGVDSEDDDAQFQLREKVDQMAAPEEEEPKSKLASMKFMQRADEAQRKRNEEDLQRLRQDLWEEGEGGNSEPEVNMGRRIFGPQQSQPQPAKPTVQRNELEEPESSDEERAVPKGEDGEDDVVQQKPDSARASRSEPKTNRQSLQMPGRGASQVPKITNSMSAASSREPSADRPNGTHDATASSTAAVNETPANTNNWTTVPFSTPSPDPHADSPSNNHIAQDSEAASDAGDADLSLAPQDIDQAALVAKAFGFDTSASKSFTQEKAAAESSEDDHFQSTALPGWGTWAGEGLSQRAIEHSARRSQSFIKKTQGGVTKEKRKDKGKKNVILSEKKVRKNGKYLAGNLPHPYESREQYERSLRVPVGPEWSPKESFQRMTKPRVMVRQGVVRPMRKPLG